MNTAFGYIVYAAMLYIGFEYYSALIIATICGIIFNFHSIGKLVFMNFKYSFLLKFMFVYAFVFFINLLLIKVFIICGANVYLSGALALLPSAATSFLLNKYFVFNR